MTEQELNKLLDKAIGTKGNLKVPSFWMRRIFKELIEWCKSQNNSQNNSQDYITEEELNSRNYATYSDLNNKQDWIPDLTTIRNNANNALKSIPSEYVTETELEQKKCRINWYMIVNHHTRYLTFDALEDGNFSFHKQGTGDDIQYSKDNGSTWTPLASDEPISVITGDKVIWKSTIIPSSVNGVGLFSSSGKFNIGGNIMSLLYGDDFIGKTSLSGKNWAFYRLFYECTNVVEARNLILPATTLSTLCYGSMFRGCKSLTTAPKLPATTLSNACYSQMFMNCKSLTTAPELPATKLVNECYDFMFEGCTKLSEITMLATDISAWECLYGWVQAVSSTGTFYKNPEMNSLPLANYDNNYVGIPNGWTVVDYVES